MMRAILGYFDVQSMIDIYYTLFYPHVLSGIEFWGHGNTTDLNRILMIQKATLYIVLKLKPLDHVTSYFETPQIRPLKILFEYHTLKLKNSTVLNNFKKPLYYNTRSTN